MSAELDAICQICRRRPATHHIWISNGTTEEAHTLCRECYEKSASPEQLDSNRKFEEVLRSGKCNYCGDPPVGGSGGWSEDTGQSYHLWCEACRLDLVEFNTGPGKRSFEEYPFDDEEAQIRIVKELEEIELARNLFMQRKIAARKGSQ